ncbi:unnamed protein product [Tuber aestivum]|uniref:Uncharacterized protein n=1 Tax=Tuber aestivum TaxID=59557 RepID=A0A292PRJ2_9PEZI|nr:unnamed protein product [Tuber aestivum]
MSPPPKSVLLPKVFPPSLVNLGQLLPDPRDPSLDPCIPERPATEDDYAKTVYSGYTTTVTLDESARLSVSLTNLFGALFGARKASTIDLHAPTAYHIVLKQPDTIFSRVVQEPDVQNWLNRMAQFHRRVYFIVGLQVIIDGVLKQKIDTSSEASVNVCAPLEAAGLPVHVSAETTGFVKGEGFMEGTILGENVLGVLVRRVCYKIERPSSRPTLDHKSAWRYPCERVRGAQEEEVLELVVSMGDDVGDDDLGDLGDGSDGDGDDDDDEED